MHEVELFLVIHPSLDIALILKEVLYTIYNEITGSLYLAF